MIYLHGDTKDPSTWHLVDEKITDCLAYDLINLFKSKKEARIWVIKELRRRVEEISKVKHEWMHPKDKGATAESTT